MFAGRPHETGGNAGPRWMAVSPATARSPGDRTRRTGRLVCRTPPPLPGRGPRLLHRGAVALPEQPVLEVDRLRGDLPLDGDGPGDLLSPGERDRVDLVPGGPEFGRLARAVRGRDLEV